MISIAVELYVAIDKLNVSVDVIERGSVILGAAANRKASIGGVCCSI